MLRVRHLLAREHPRLRELRLEALAADPAAFGATHERDAAKAPEWWEEWAAASELGAMQRRFVLVNDDDRWLGLTLVRLVDEQPGSAALHAMWVAPQARSRRACVLLCDACAAWASERGARELILSVLIENGRARRAYEAAGFVVRAKATGN